VTAVVFARTAHAASASRTLIRIARKTAAVADNVPIRHLDEVLEAVGNRQVRETLESGLEAELRRLGKVSGDLDSATRVRMIAREAPTLAHALARGGDSNLLRQLDNLDEATKVVAIAMARGGDEVATAIPDMLTRARFVERGGAPVMIAAGTGGKEFIQDAMRLDALFQSGRVIQAPGRKAATLTDFGVIMLKAPDATRRFWREYVQPHWKLWAGGTALAIYLTDPEYFQDKAGDLTETGAKHFGEALIKIGGRGLKGLAEGTTSGGKEFASSILSLFSPYALLGMTPLVLVLILAWPRSRRMVGKIMRKAWYPPNEMKTNADKDHGKDY
jgi:hypothetical protein